MPWLFMPRRGSLNDKALVGARFASIEVGSEAYVLDLLGAKKHGAALRDLLPLLDGRHDWAALSQSGPLAERLLDWLDAAALLEANDQTLAAPFPPTHVTWLGHAAVLVKVGAATIAIDPLFFTDSAPRRPGREALPDPRALPIVDAIAITHGDNDHLNPHSLARFSRDTPIIIPRCREARPYQVDIEAVVRFLGFTDVRTLGDWESVAIKDVQLTAAPFVGEDWGLELAKATYVVSGPSGAVYLTADAAAMPEVWQKVAELLFRSTSPSSAFPVAKNRSFARRVSATVNSMRCGWSVRGATSGSGFAPDRASRPRRCGSCTLAIFLATRPAAVHSAAVHSWTWRIQTVARTRTFARW